MARTPSIPSLTNLSWLEELTFERLTRLAEAIRSEIDRKRDEAKEQLRAELVEKARSLGIDPTELLPSHKTRVNRTEVKPKYRAPDGSTWAGRGRAPRVFKELFDKGHSKDEFLIKS